jgi:Protein of unknown function (DUF322).
MKIRVLDRILVAVAGIILLAVCAGLVAQVFFQADVIHFISDLINVDSRLFRIAAAVISAVLLLIGMYCILMLFRHRSKRDKFILQKMETGDLAISLKALETMVSKCMEQHTEIQTEGIRLENQRDGLIIRIRGKVAGGISIPLTIDTLQKQIKQYVTACSGVEVKGIRVQIESSGEEAPDAPFAIDPPASLPLLRGIEKKEESPDQIQAPENQKEVPAAAETVIQEEPAASSSKSAAEAALEAAESRMKEFENEDIDDRPIHQRLFSTPEEPCIMPLPPEDLTESSVSIPGEGEETGDVLSDKKPEGDENGITAEPPSSDAEESTEKKE